MRKQFHLCTSVEGALKNRAFNCFDDDNGRPIPPKDAKQMLLEMRQKGIKYFVGSHCDNQSDEGRCLGHPIED